MVTSSISEAIEKLGALTGETLFEPFFDSLRCKECVSVADPVGDFRLFCGETPMIPNLSWCPFPFSGVAESEIEVRGKLVERGICKFPDEPTGCSESLETLRFSIWISFRGFRRGDSQVHPLLLFDPDTVKLVVVDEGKIPALLSCFLPTLLF